MLRGAGAVLGRAGAAGIPAGAARAVLPALPPDPARALLDPGDQQVAGRGPPTAEGRRAGRPASCPPRGGRRHGLRGRSALPPSGFLPPQPSVRPVGRRDRPRCLAPGSRPGEAVAFPFPAVGGVEGKSLLGGSGAPPAPPLAGVQHCTAPCRAAERPGAAMAEKESAPSNLAGSWRLPKNTSWV